MLAPLNASLLQQPHNLKERSPIRFFTVGMVLASCVVLMFVAAFYFEEDNFDGSQNLDHFLIKELARQPSWPPHYVKSDPTNNRLVDEMGRTLLFHGVNAVAKSFPFSFESPSTFDPMYSLVDKDMDDLVSWGHNIVRIGVLWAGVEPARGRYNDTYLAIMKDLVDRLYSKGIMTIVDMHQDAMNERFCGEGFPRWAVDLNSRGWVKFPLPVRLRPYETDDDGIPLRSECKKEIFAKYYASAESAITWQNFWEDANGFQTAFVKFWGHVAKAFKDSPGVIGYDIINEPFVGNLYAHPMLVVPGHADLVHLQPLYQRIHAEIRKVDSAKSIVFEPFPAFDIMSESGFTEGPGGPEFNDRQILSYHVYCLQKENGDPVNAFLCGPLETYFTDIRIKDAARLGVVGMMTEFGANAGDNEGVDEMLRMTRMADDKLQSWMYWQFKDFGDITTAGDASQGFYDPDGTLQSRKVEALSRSYALATAGLIERLNFDDTTGTFVLEYTYVPSGNTVIYLSQDYHYPNGFNVYATDGLSFQKYPNYLEVTHPRTMPTGTPVHVLITAH